MTWLAPVAGHEDAPPRVALAVSRAHGGAVVRNRIRRRLRGALVELQRAGDVPAGAYLVAARREAADQGFQSLLSDLRTAIGSATDRGGA